MKYIIMCGGIYPKWKSPRQLEKINGEVIVERTIRLLRENGITDIAISTNDERFNYLDVEILNNKNDKFVTLSPNGVKASQYSWLNAYYPINEEVCYLHGDVYFSDEAIKTIVEAEVKDTMFFCTCDDTSQKDLRNAKGREPLAYKVVNYKLFRNAVDDLLNMIDNGEFKDAKCSPIAWNVYRYLNGLDIGKHAQGYGDLNSIYDSKGDYIVINDYTTDVDSIDDIKKIENFIRTGGKRMIKVEVIEEFTLRDFYKLRNIERKARAVEGRLFKGDTFECDENMMKYLTGDNQLKKVVVKVIEVIPEVKKEVVIADPIVKAEKKSKKKKK